MGEHVPLEVTSVCAGVFTLCATERRFSSVFELVTLEMVGLSEGIVTLVTSNRLLS